MRAMYSLKKWYFDFLTPHNDYVFIYFAAARLGPATMRSLTVNLARPGKGVLLTRCLPVALDESTPANGILLMRGGRISRTERQCLLDFSDNHCSVRLCYELSKDTELRPLVITTGGRSSVRWKPFGLKHRVAGSVTLDAARVDVDDASGYIDYLESSCLPPLVPVRTMYWGRVAHPSVDLVYSRAADRNGTQTWSALYGRAGEMSFDTDRVCIEPAHPDQSADRPSALGDGYALHAMTAAGSVRMSVRHQSVIQQGSFIDQQDRTSSLARYLLKLLTRNPRSTKFLSSGDVIVELRGLKQQQLNIPMIDEYVLL